MPKGEWRLAGVMGVAERPADNGLGALNSPGFGFETEPSGRVADRTDSWKSPAWKRRRRAGAMTS
jgi:hypothetical protein